MLGDEAVQLCAHIQPDVVLMDLVMPGMDGAAATQAIRQICPQAQVIVLTTFKDEALVQKALRAGAIGYLLKDVLADELAEAIRSAHVGRSTLSQEATQALIHSTDESIQLGYDLSEREYEVLALMVKGEQYRDRRAADRQPIDGQAPRQPCPLQAWHQQPRRSCRSGRSASPGSPIRQSAPNQMRGATTSSARAIEGAPLLVGEIVRAKRHQCTRRTHVNDIAIAKRSGLRFQAS